ncbi:MAG: OmpH family outer membrane protein [bacterium]|nr:OmpH family outer membrane protein [bacterium]
MSKKLVMVLAFAVLSAVTPNVLKAQSKVGHVNFQEIILLMPEYTMAATEYDLYQAALEDNLKEIENMILKAQNDYAVESKKPAPNKARLNIYIKQNETFQQEYQLMQQSTQDSLKAKMAELVAPIKKKVELVIAEIAKEKGYSHIIDNSYGTLIYADEADNIDAAVKTRLKIKDKPVANPAAGRTIPQR